MSVVVGDFELIPTQAPAEAGVSAGPAAPVPGRPTPRVAADIERTLRTRTERRRRLEAY